MRKYRPTLRYTVIVNSFLYQVISYTLRDIKDEESYMESMGEARTSEVLRDARIGEAECNRWEE